MTSVPYPTFLNLPPIDSNNGRAALPAVGKCRIYPESCTPTNLEYRAEYRAIVSKCIDQVFVDASDAAGDARDTNKKLKKKLMKEGVAMARKYLTETLQLDVSVIDVEIVMEGKDIVESNGCLASCLLDAGAHAIVMDGTDLPAMDAAAIPRGRMIAHFDRPFCSASWATSDADVNGSILVKALRDAADFASVMSVGLSAGDDINVEGVLEDIDYASSDEVGVGGLKLVVQFSPEDSDVKGGDEALAEMIGKISKGCGGRGTVSIVDPTARQLGLSYVACLKTDREDGLYTTVVCTRNGEALGLVYSSKESVVAALECGRGVYYSRSREGLWRKGDTSGHYQTLHRIDTDCDGDALRFTVTQRGNDTVAFCHLNTLTCWGEPRGLRHLEGTLKQRLKEAPEGSYTKRLFEDEELLRDKLVEEAQELSEAETPQHVAEELADVLYFAMVRAVKAGVSIDDAVVELDRRARKVTRRKGDSKAFRIAAGKEILDKAAESGGKGVAGQSST